MLRINLIRDKVDDREEYLSVFQGLREFFFWGESASTTISAFGVGGGFVLELRVVGRPAWVGDRKVEGRVRKVGMWVPLHLSHRMKNWGADEWEEWERNKGGANRTTMARVGDGRVAADRNRKPELSGVRE